MQKGTRCALLLGAVPFLTLVFALPLVNRIHPIILGLPFILFWILAWVALTPFILFLAYKVAKKFNVTDEGHDGHMAILMGVTELLSRRKDQFKVLGEEKILPTFFKRFLEPFSSS